MARSTTAPALAIRVAEIRCMIEAGRSVAAIEETLARAWLMTRRSLRRHTHQVLDELAAEEVEGRPAARARLCARLEFLYEAAVAKGDLRVAARVVETQCRVAGIFAPDQATEEFLRGKTEKTYTIYSSDRNALYRETLKIDVTALTPQVALPSSPANAVPVEAAPEVKLDQVVIGSCTNGRIEDLRIAARILAGHRAAPGLRLIILPATPTIYQQALREGLIETFLSARAVIAPPSCGPCLGGHLGVIAAGEQALATTNRNFPGRMGHPDSRVYLSGPAVAAASAITGRITHPREIVSTPPAPEAK